MGLLLALNALFLVAMLGMVARTHGPKLLRRCACCKRDDGLGLQHSGRGGRDSHLVRDYARFGVDD